MKEMSSVGKFRHGLPRGFVFAIRVLTFSQSEGESNGRLWHFAATCFDPIIGAMMLKALVDEYKLLGQFRHECRLLRSLSGGEADIARTPQNGRS
jgi:hypothetical protein